MFPAAPRMGLTALAAEQGTAAPRADCAKAMPDICTVEGVQIVTGKQSNARHSARTVGALITESSALAG